MKAGLVQMGWATIGLGEFSSIKSNADRCLELYDADAHAADRSWGPIDVRVEALTLRAFAKWFSGFPDQSAASSREAIAYARKLIHSVCGSRIFMLPWEGSNDGVRVRLETR